jgi:hypothetical protein
VRQAGRGLSASDGQNGSDGSDSVNGSSLVESGWALVRSQASGLANGLPCLSNGDELALGTPSL